MVLVSDSTSPFAGLTVGGTGIYGTAVIVATQQKPASVRQPTYAQIADSVEIEREADANSVFVDSAPAFVLKRGQRPNRYGGKCERCGIHVRDGEGVLTGSKGNWGVAHLDGACPERQAKLPGTENVPVVPKPKQKRRNRFGGKCGLCERYVQADQGWLEQDDDEKWVVFHDGSCPSEFPFPEGRYAAENDEGELRFYHCASDGEVYVMASDNEHLLQRSAADAVIAKIALDPLAASKAFGWEFKRCGLCNRGLTDASSRAAGIGPVCSQKGWG